MEKTMQDKTPLITSRDTNLGDLVWVQLPCSSWWLAQAVDEDLVCAKLKPRNKSAGEILVRLYGSCKYLYVDPTTCHMKFEDKLEAHGGNYMDILKETLKQELNNLRSGRSRRKELKSEEFASDEVSKDGISKQNVTDKRQDTTTANSAKNSVGRSNQRLSARRIKVMQTLGLRAPSGSPFRLKSWPHFSQMEYL